MLEQEMVNMREADDDEDDKPPPTPPPPKPVRRDSATNTDPLKKEAPPPPPPPPPNPELTEEQLRAIRAKDELLRKRDETIQQVQQSLEAARERGDAAEKRVEELADTLTKIEHDAAKKQKEHEKALADAEARTIGGGGDGGGGEGRDAALAYLKEQAEAALEEAVTISSKHGLWLFEMLALRDLKKCVLDADGRGQEGTRRLKPVLQKMKGPPAELTKPLGEGLGAEEILRP